ncbi:MAG: primase [Bacteroidota bacterium]|nr:primase [Bacteroidota bacterium]
MGKNNLIEEVTCKLLLLLDKVTNGDIETWLPLSGLAYNPHSEHVYSSLNQLLLSLELYEKNYSYNNWLTFKQIKKEGGSVVKDARSVMVTFTDTAYTDADGKSMSAEAAKLALLEAKTSDSSISTYLEIGILTRRFLKFYPVFNVAQTEGLPDVLIKPQSQGLTEIEKHSLADEIINDTGANIVHVAGNSAHFNGFLYKIQMPMLQQFSCKENYYATLFHELIHWAGHPNRLHWDFKGDAENLYAFEELVAELGSAFLCGEVGIRTPLKSNAAYIKSWLRALQNDHMYLLKAVSYADRATQYILKRQRITV